MEEDRDGLWRQAVEWLTAFGVLPADHRCCSPDSKLIDLLYTLRDGVLLCHLLHKIDPASLDFRDVSLKPQMAQFLCAKNIRTFLLSCSKHYNIREADLFDPSMLFDYTDFGKVLRTLSVLSHTPKALSRGVPGFPADADQTSEFEEPIYRHLDEQANVDDRILSDRLRSHLIRRRSNGRMEENIYEDLCYVSLKDKPVTAKAPLEKRDYCLNELLETEANYVSVLEMLREKFMEPLRPLLGPDHTVAIFQGIQDLEEIHKRFHRDLVEACRPDSGTRISTVFLQNKSRFLLYGDYCSNLQPAQELIDDLCEKDETLNQKVAKCQMEANGGKFKLRDLLSVPMQRILKYEILLRELLKHTMQSLHSDDHSGLERALSAMRDVAEYINEVKRDNETLQIMNDIQNSITDWPLEDGAFRSVRDCGRLLKDGEIKIKCHPDNKMKLRYVFIFDEIFLMCKSTRIVEKMFWGEQYCYKDSLRIRDFYLDDKSQRTEARWSHSWHLVHKERKTVYQLFAKTEEMKRIWIKAIEEALEHVDPSENKYTDHTFSLTTFSGPEECDTCLKLLKGIFLQGYRCSQCQRKAHKHCIQASGMCGARQPPSLPPRPPQAEDSEADVCAVQLPSRSAPTHHQLRRHATLPRSPPALRLSECRDERSAGFQGSPMNGRYTTPRTRPASSLSASRSLSSSGTGESAVSSPVISLTHQPDYVNLSEEEQPWWAGEMDRVEAERALENRAPGTFLVRVSAAQDNKTVLSLRAAEKVSHMKIRQSDDTPTRYSLSPARLFPSITQLVQYYQHNSLSENFSGLLMSLGRPLRQDDRAVVKFKYTPNGRAPNMLPLNVGDEVVILSRDSESQGWWKGRIGDRMGYFPKSYVQELG
ncbi:protein vav-like isoform X3 [Amphibalanus amphitrite]|uniref:protein vav-like isoform X3 n=1 Tax=Amphibalanus amphitrite TaxID=1232801 RepID=UPI001C916B38|nr:protein vav-like isoform X3 [Amphibalanus amphitrite]